MPFTILMLFTAIIASGCHPMGADIVREYPTAEKAPAENEFRNHLPEVVIYKGDDFSGEEMRTHLGYDYLSSDSRDTIASVIVVSGKWQFCAGHDFKECVEVGPGYYRSLKSMKIDRAIMSFFPVL